MELLNIGYGNLISKEKIVAIIGPESAPIRRFVQEARDKGILVDASFGRRTRSVIITDDGHVVLSALQTETVASRAVSCTGKLPVEAGNENA
jgi:regulator of extracellular matrix RemA (YlzA/DUF370 family)